MTAPDRYERSFGLRFDAAVTQVQTRVPRTAEIAALPGVEDVRAITFVFGGLVKSGSTTPLDALVFAGSFLADGRRLVSGAAPDPSQPGDFVATRSFATAQQAAIGDEFRLITLTQEQGETNGFSDVQPAGPTLTARLVGIVDGPSEVGDSTAVAFFGDALLSAGDIGLSQTNMAVTLRPHVSLAQLRAQIDNLPQRDDFSVSPSEMISSTIRRAVDAQAKALWLLAAVGIVASIAVLGQVIGRHVRLSTADREALSAVGYSTRDRFVEALGVASVPIIFGAVAAIGIATIPSALFPTSFARRLEPSPGVHFDWAVLIAGAMAGIVGTALWTSVSVALDQRRRSVASAPRAIDSVASRLPSPTMASGLRLALTPRRTDRGSVVASQIAVMVIVAGVAAAVVFGSSLNRLVDEPGRYGSNYDYVIGNQGAESLPPEVTQRLRSDPSITALTAYAVDHARVGDATVEVLGVEQVLGDITPEVLIGRLPRSEDEVAFGRVDANRVGAHVGHTVTVSGPTGEREFTVTGIVVVSGLGPNDGLGQGAVMSLPALEQLDHEAGIVSEVVRVRADTDGPSEHLAQLIGAPPSPPFQPGAITNVVRIRAIPFVVAAFLLALGIVTVAQVTLASARARRGEMATLRALGADRWWIGRTIHWQATWCTAAAVIVGPPLGVLLGRTVFRAFARSMGAVETATAAPLLLSVLAATFVIVANVCAVPARRRASRPRAAAMLRAE